MDDKKAQLVEKRHEQILTAAKHLFARNGFRRTQIDDIANSITIGKGTIYRYFKDKKSLFLAVFEQGIACLRLAMDSIYSIADPRQRIAAAVKTYFEFFDNDREFIELMMQVRSEFKDDYRRIFLAVYSDYIVKIQNDLSAGVQMGVFREMNVEKTADAISAALQGILQSFYIREFGSGTESLTDKTNAVTALLLDGLLKR